MTHELTKPGGWSNGQTLTGAEATDLDNKTYNSIDKTGDEVFGTIEFTGSGTISLFEGGSLSLYGEGTDGYVSEGARIIFESGDALVLGEAGSGDWPTFTAPRTHVVWVHPNIIGGNSTIEAPSAFMEKYSASFPAVRTNVSVSTGDYFFVAIPDPPRNATIDAISVFTKGITGDASGSIGLPTFTLYRSVLTGAGAAVLVEVPTFTDVHQVDGSDWTDIMETEVTGIAEGTSGSVGFHYLKVTNPYNISIGADMHFLGAKITYTCTELRI